jgi:two-component system, NarL family, nitrate/nitrite response regulator NarL
VPNQSAGGLELISLALRQRPADRDPLCPHAVLKCEAAGGRKDQPAHAKFRQRSDGRFRRLAPSVLRRVATATSESRRQDVSETTGEFAGQPVRILLADDHPIFRLGLRSLLESEPDFEVVGEATDAAEAIALVHTLRPDLVLLGLSARGGGLQLLSALESAKGMRVIVLVARGSREDLTGVIRRGALGVVPKDAPPDLLLRCVRAVLAGEYWMSRATTADLIEALRRPPEIAHERRGRDLLTPREREVIATVVAGASNRAIALQFGISEQTVKHHLTSIFDKVGVSSRLELALYAVHHRLVDPDV